MGSVVFRPVSTYQTSAATIIEGGAGSKEASLSDQDYNTGIRKDGPTNLLDASERYRLNTFFPTVSNAKVSAAILNIAPATPNARTDCTWGDFIFRAMPLPAYKDPNSSEEAILFGPTRAVVGASYTHNGAVQLASFNLSSQLFLYHKSGTLIGLRWEQIDWKTLQVEFSTQLNSGEAAQLRELSLSLTYNSVPSVSTVAPADLSGGVSFTSSPLITWSYTDLDGDPQTQARLILVPPYAVDSAGRKANTTNFDATTANVKLYDSGIVSTSTPSMRATNSRITDGVTYYAYVQAYQAPVLGAAQGSAWAVSSLVTADITPPNSPTINVVARTESASLDVNVLMGDKTTGVIDGSVIDVERYTGSETGWTSIRNGDTVTTASGVRIGSPGTSAFNLMLTEDGDTLITEGSEDLNLESSSSGNAVTTLSSTAINNWSSADSFIIAMCVAFETSSLSVQQPILISKWLLTGGVNQASWMLSIDSSGHLLFSWTTNGDSGATLHTAQGPILTVTPYVPIWIRIRFYNENPWRISFRTSNSPPDTDAAFIELSDPTWVTGVAGPYVPYASYAPVVLGAYNVGGDGNTPLRVYSAWLMDPTPDVFANAYIATFNIDGQPLTSTNYTDGANNLWIIGQTPTNQAKLFVRVPDYEVLPNLTYYYQTKVTGYDDATPLTTAGVQATGIYAFDPANRWWWIKSVYTPKLNVNREIHLGSWDGKRPVDAAAFAALGRANKIVVSDVVHGRELVLRVDCMTLEEYQAVLDLYKSSAPVFIHSQVENGYFKLTDWDEDRGLLNGYNVVTLKAIEIDKPVVL